MTDASSHRILALTSWRGIFALGVVLFHSGESLFMELATGGVVGFFVMSGFLVRMWHDPAQISGKRHRYFFLKRALRIYPLHWLALALLLAECVLLHMPLTYGNWSFLLPNLLLLQSYVPREEVFFSFNTPSWFLCDLLLCYLCYPWVARWLGKLGLRAQVLLVCALTAVYAAVMGTVTDKNLVTYTHVFPLLRLYEFGIGIVACHAYTALLPRVREKNWGFAKATLVEALPVALWIGLMVFSHTWDYPHKDNFNDSVMWELPMALLLTATALCAGSEGAIGRVLRCRPLVWLGELSFEMFLLHFVSGPVFTYFVGPLFGHFGIMVYDYYAVGQLPILLAMSYAMHRWFTRPVFAWAARVAS